MEISNVKTSRIEELIFWDLYAANVVIMDARLRGNAHPSFVPSFGRMFAMILEQCTIAQFY